MAYLTGATPKGKQQLTVSSSAVSLTVPGPANNIPGANYATIRCTAANVRWNDDGTNAPTTNVGQQLFANEILDYDGNLGALQFIRDDATDAVLDIQYFRVG